MKTASTLASSTLASMATTAVAERFFSIVRDNVVFRMEMMGFEDDPRLNIRILYCDAQEEYELNLATEDCKQNTMGGQLEGLEDLFRLIRRDFSLIEIKPHGLIHIVVSANAKDKDIQLSAQRCQTIRSSSLMLQDLSDRISQLKLEAEERNESLCQKNFELQMKLNGKSKAISGLESRVSNLKSVIKNQDEEIHQLRRILGMVLNQSESKGKEEQKSTEGFGKM